MFRRPNKKQLLIRRIIVSIITVLSVIVIVTGTILFILGYRLDSEKGQLEQGALLQFDSKPSGASVTIDSKAISARTATKQSVIAGLHSFIVTKDGYEPWAKSLDVKAGTLTWLDYIRLVPKNLKAETVATYGSLYGEKASPDFKMIIVQEKADVPTFQIVDIRSPDIKTAAISLPTTVYSDASTDGVAHTFSLQTWDEGGRYILLKHLYSDKNEWIVVDTQNIGSSVNITRLFSLGLADVKFSGTSGRILYGLASDGIIRKLDVSAGTISRSLVTNVKSFDIFETNILSYVGTNPANANQQVAGVYREGDETAHVLRTVDSLTTSLLIDATRYFSDDYIAITEGLKVTMLKGRYPTSSQDDATSLKQYAEFTAPSNVDAISFSSDGDFLVVQSGLNMISYEVEYKRETRTTIATSETQPHTMRWLDPAYLWATYDGHLSIREFDGSNVHVINVAEPVFDATLTENGRYLYSVTKSDTAYQLQRVKMILE
ncbi:MAG: PEGA domain-containing protein [Candidatus Microsaccharimonas sp.]